MGIFDGDNSYSFFVQKAFPTLVMGVVFWEQIAVWKDLHEYLQPNLGLHAFIQMCIKYLIYVLVS